MIYKEEIWLAVILFFFSGCENFYFLNLVIEMLNIFFINCFGGFYYILYFYKKVNLDFYFIWSCG